MDLEYIWNLIINNFFGCLLVFARVTGIFTFNPIFGRQNVPMRVRTSLSIVLTFIMLASMGGDISLMMPGVFGFAVTLLFEALLGLVFGFVVNLMLSVLIYAGEIIDNQIGLSMAKTMDPSTGIQMPVFANYFYYLFILYFFVTGGHLEYIRLFAISYDIIPIGFQINENTLALVHNIVMFLGVIMVLALKLAMPILAAELIVEFCLGVIMKAVPNIQILVINIQFKIVFGLLMIMLVSVPMSDFVETLLGIMWDNLEFILNSFI